MQTFESILAAVIDRGINGAMKDYAKRPDKLKGSVAGFKACEGLDAGDLQTILREARTRTHQAHLHEAEDYWEVRCYEAEIEWVCNCMGCFLGYQVGGVPMTVRGALNINAILKNE